MIYGFFIEMICLTKCDCMMSLRYVFGERAHVLTEASTEHSRAIAMVVTVAMLFYYHDVVMQGSMLRCSLSLSLKHNIESSKESVMAPKTLIIIQIKMTIT